VGAPRCLPRLWTARPSKSHRIASRSSQALRPRDGQRVRVELGGVGAPNRCMLRRMSKKQRSTMGLLVLALTAACARKSAPAHSEAPAVATGSAGGETAPADEPRATEAAEEEPATEEKAAAPGAQPAEPVAPSPAPPPPAAGRDRAESDRKDDLAQPAKPKSSKKSTASRGAVDSVDEESRADIEQAARELEANFERLGDALRLATPDCPSARQFGQRICDLAERICRIAERGDDSDQLALCVDGRNRCAESQRRLAERCP